MYIPDASQILDPQDDDSEHFELHHELRPTITSALADLERQQLRPTRSTLPEEIVNGVHDDATQTSGSESSAGSSDEQTAIGSFLPPMDKQDAAGESLIAISSSVAKRPSIVGFHSSSHKTCDCGTSTSDTGDAMVNLISTPDRQDIVGDPLIATSTEHSAGYTIVTALDEWERNAVESKVPTPPRSATLTARSSAPIERPSIITAFDEWHRAIVSQVARTLLSEPARSNSIAPTSIPSITTAFDDLERNVARNQVPDTLPAGSVDAVHAPVQQSYDNESQVSHEQVTAKTPEPPLLDGSDAASEALSTSSVAPGSNPTISTASEEQNDHKACHQAQPTLLINPNIRVDQSTPQINGTTPSNESDSSWSIMASQDSSKEVVESKPARRVASANDLEIDNKGRPWWKGVVAYQVWPMSFKDSNGDGIGDLQGIISKLDYLKDFGIDMIWLSPTYKSPLDDWGYDISDYEDMHDQFGALSDIETLIECVHARGMRIILDLVITHTSDQHIWFKESAKSKDSPKADWYMWADKRPGNMIEGQLVEEPSNWRAAFGGSAWTHVAARDQYYIHLFLDSQPDLNWHNPEMREAVYQSAIKFWIDRGVDGFRLDTANRFCKNPEYPDVEVSVPGKWQPGSQHYINGPEMHKWLKEIRTKMDRDSNGKDLMIVGELPLTPYEDLLKYVHPDEKELSMVFDFDMVKLGNNDNPDEYAKHQVSNYMDHDPSYTLPKFKDSLARTQSLITDSGAWGTVFMENHDQPRSIARYATPEHKYWRKAGKLLALLQTTLSGTEFIYQGQEIGMLNMPESWGVSEFRDPDAKIYVEDYCNDYREIDPNARENAIHGVFKVGRDNSRTPMQWSAEANGGFTGSNPTWMKVNDNFSWLNVEAQKADEFSIWNFWKAGIAMRKEYKELFMFGTFALYDHDNEHTFTYTKMAEDGQMALIILNLSNDELPLNTPQRHLLGHTYRMISSNVAEPLEKLQAWEGRVYIIRDGLQSGEEGKPDRVSEVQDKKVQSKAGADLLAQLG